MAGDVGRGAGRNVPRHHGDGAGASTGAGYLNSLKTQKAAKCLSLPRTVCGIAGMLGHGDRHELSASEAAVGLLHRDDDGGTLFRYLRDDLPHPISISLPVREAPFGDPETRAFFSNLLFDSPVRDQVMAAHGLPAQDFVELLRHLAADCPGAISCVPRRGGSPKTPGRIDTD